MVIQKVHQQWLHSGEEHRIPLLAEGRERGIIAEIYYMHHLPSGKGYVGMAYHGAHERLCTHWKGRNREKDPSSVLMSTSASPYEWLCWPMERFPGSRRGHVLFHKRAAHREGWWATELRTWWPRGLNVAGTGGEHKGGAREDWLKYRELFRKEWRDQIDERMAEGRQQVQALSHQVDGGAENAWEELTKVPLDSKRQMLQALNMDPHLGGSLRHKLERLLREDLRQHKSMKKKPKGDFVKLLLTHKGWNATEVRSIIREPEVC